MSATTLNKLFGVQEPGTASRQCAWRRQLKPAFPNRLVKGPIVSLLCILSLAALFPQTLRAALNVYGLSASNPNIRNEPTPNPGDPWTRVSGDPGGPYTNSVLGIITLGPNADVCLACCNTNDNSMNKLWELTLGSTNADHGAVTNLEISSPVGLSSSNESTATVTDGKITKNSYSDAALSEFVHIFFIGQPLWERLAIHNSSTNPIGFNVTASAICQKGNMTYNQFNVGTEEYGYAGGQQGSGDAGAISIYPQNEAVDASGGMDFSAPVGSGQWTASVTYEYPDGCAAPLGGVVFTSSGPGLTNGQPSGLSFAMFPQADVQYKEFVYDSVSQTNVEFDLDLVPSLAITSSNNSVVAQFNSVLGMNYTVQDSPDLNTWGPVETFAGTGGMICWQTAATGNAQFFRVACQPAPLPTNPPAVIGIGAPANSNVLNITFSEQVDETTALAASNYFVFGGSGLIPIENVLPSGALAVQLVLGTNLMTNSSYGMGVSRVTDLNGRVMVPATFPLLVTALQTPCSGSTLLDRQTYCTGEFDGYWHVVEDDWYMCPSESQPQSFRVADTRTTQTYSAGQTPPNPVGLLYASDNDVVSFCDTFTRMGPLTVCTCNGGEWSASSYLEYQCAGGTQYVHGPIQTVPITPTTSCDEQPPFFPAPQ